MSVWNKNTTVNKLFGSQPGTPKPTTSTPKTPAPKSTVPTTGPKPTTPKPTTPTPTPTKVKIPTAQKPGAQALVKGRSAGGHDDTRHIGITPGQMIDRLHGKDPDTSKKGKKKDVVTKFSSVEQSNKAANRAMKDPKVKEEFERIKDLGPSAIGKPVTVTLKKPVEIQEMRGPKMIKVDGKKVQPQGPANFVTKKVNKVTVIPRNTPSGPGFHSNYGEDK